MKVFDLDRTLTENYRSFARSFTKIRAKDIKAALDKKFEAGRFWPDPLISINPHFERGASIEALVRGGTLHPRTGDVFRVDGASITLHRHQEQAVAKAAAGQSFVVTTGTGSGKSLCFFVPIIDAAVRARTGREAPRTRAIIVYPMNALANSQIKEIDKFLDQAGLPPELRPKVARYTGQESKEEREQIRKDKPDVLLTNFMMLELLMTRQSDLDRQVIENAQGLEYIVLDELHTYRGRQGADVAVLVRRLRDRCCPGAQPICIGTSATMASEGSEGARADAVAEVSSRLFGATIGPDAVIDETLERATDPSLQIAAIMAALPATVAEPLPARLNDSELRAYPLAVWIELAIGLDDGQSLRRRRPISMVDAALALAAATGLPDDVCRRRLEEFLTFMSLPENQRGGAGARAFLAFKLHRFIAGAGEALTTLRAAPRNIVLDGQLLDPDDPDARLYPTHFCRECGQEYHPVTLASDGDGDLVMPRSLDDRPIEDDRADEDARAGYLTPVRDDADFQFTGELETFPDDWLEERSDRLRLKSNRKSQQPRKISVAANGRVSSAGREFWFIPGIFRFCLACREQPSAGARERTKLAGLSAEGRSSATTLLVSTVLTWMNEPGNGVPPSKRKLLGFTDNRQDAALQAGHFNDFLFVTLMRAATFAAVLNAGAGGLSEDQFGPTVQRMLGFTADRAERRKEWMADPDAKGVTRSDSERALSRVLAHRVWTDQRRGWRFTNPSLSVLKLVRPDFVSLEELAGDDEAFAIAPAALQAMSHAHRAKALRVLCEVMLEGLAVGSEALDALDLEAVGRHSRSLLRDPWAMDAKETLRTATTLLLDAPRRQDTRLRDEQIILRGGSRSRLARELNKASVWGAKFGADDYLAIVGAMLAAAQDYGIVRSVSTAHDLPGWRLAPGAVRLVAGANAGGWDGKTNRHFHDVYIQLAELLRKGEPAFLGLEGREHTAQVEQDVREWREWRFRNEAEDQANITTNRDDMIRAGEPTQPLPVLFCSPTMELGVDISALNAVYLRNVPPTPANYAQRAGRAGRSGQPALILSYAAAQSPHDQYYFLRRDDMVGGIVRPPALDLANRDLIESHLHAVWLAASGVELQANIPEVLDLKSEPRPVSPAIAVRLEDPELRDRAAVPMRRVLDSILAAIGPDLPRWLGDDLDGYVIQVAEQAPGRFSKAFDRWRELHRSAWAQLEEANRRSQTTGLPASERAAVRAAQAQANEQITILEEGRARNGSDFYTYRYLATEGFLPGYNFPRLPLYAYVPAAHATGGRGAFLQRARFLAISEFGPRSLIYHEGRAFRVYKAKLPPEARSGSGLATRSLFVCDACGASHDEERERCHACNASMAGVVPIHKTLRIDNVETSPAERITANDEERVRQGFEIQTVFAWPIRDGHLDIETAEVRSDRHLLINLQAANGAQISRLNKGLKRRKKKSILGFGIDPASGRWTKAPGDDDTDDAPPDTPAAERIVPIVRDHKNAALLRPAGVDAIGDTTMATLQHALLRGIEVEFQLEEGEILTEPLPSRDNRRAILAYEATEGGAGVLARLVREVDAFARVARRALEMMHFEGVDAATAAADPRLLVDAPDAKCVKGCYRCLLSYYNQPDHEHIDRADEGAKRILVALAGSTVAPGSTSSASGKSVPSSEGRVAADSLIAALAAADIPPADERPLDIGDMRIPLVWRSYRVAATCETITNNAHGEADAKGFALFQLPSNPAATSLPADFLNAFG